MSLAGARASPRRAAYILCSTAPPFDTPENYLFQSFSIPLWLCEALGDILTSIVSNSYFGKRPGAREITTFGSIVSFMLPEMLNYMTL